MSSKLSLILAVVVAALGIGVYLSTFTVHQTQQAVVLQFGAIVDKVPEPGIKFKAPWQDVLFLENRVLNLDTSKQTIVLADQRRVEVSAFVRYRINDPEQFIRVAVSETNLRLRLEPILTGRMRAVLGRVLLPNVLSEERTGLMRQIRDQVNVEVRQEESNFGIDVLDVRIVRADLLKEVSQAVFERMENERKRDAANFRAEGQEQFLRISAEADRDATVIRAEAQRSSDFLRGAGEGARTRILNDAFGQDPGFFEFYRSMVAYEAAMQPGNTSMVISPTNEFFTYFNDPSGAARSEAREQEKTE